MSLLLELDSRPAWSPWGWNRTPRTSQGAEHRVGRSSLGAEHRVGRSPLGEEPPRGGAGWDSATGSHLVLGEA